MAFVKGEAITGFPFELLHTVTGAPITSGAVDGYYLIDGGAQAALTGTATHEGNGQWSWDTIPAAAMNGTLIGLLFVHADGRASFTFRTSPATYGELVAGTPSEVALCNLALLDIGDEVIESLLDDSDRARMCRHIYPAARDEMLTVIQPHAAVRRATLAGTTTPLYGWDYAFALPSGCLVPLDVDDDESAWSREGATILSNWTPINLRYVYRLEDVTQWPQHFTRAVVAYLAARFASARSRPASVVQEKYRYYEYTKDEALAIEGQEGTPAIYHTRTLTTDVRS